MLRGCLLFVACWVFGLLCGFVVNSVVVFLLLNLWFILFSWFAGGLIW